MSWSGSNHDIYHVYIYISLNYIKYIMIHIIYWQLGQETSLPATFSSHLGSWSEGNWILHTMLEDSSARASKKNRCTMGQCFCSMRKNWMQRMDAKNGWKKHLESLWCFQFLVTILVWFPTFDVSTLHLHPRQVSPLPQCPTMKSFVDECMTSLGAAGRLGEMLWWFHLEVKRTMSDGDAVMLYR